MSKRRQSIFMVLVVAACIVCSAEQKTSAQPAAAASQPQTLSIPPDSPRWELEGQAKPAEYQGRKCLFLDGGAAILKDFEMRDGVLDADVATPAIRGFFGFDFRIDPKGENYEEVYLRQHKSGLPDAPLGGSGSARET